MDTFSTSSAAVPLVLLHGIPGSSRIWAAVTEHLGDAADVHAPDLAGFGSRAERLPIEELRAETQAVELARRLDELGVRNALIVGHDFGGPVALHLLAHRPDLVGGMVLLAANVFPDTPIPLPLRPIAVPWLGRLYARIVFSRAALRAMTLGMVGRPRLRLDRAIYVGSNAQARSIRLIFADALAHLGERYRSFPEIMASTSRPVTVMWGDRDPFFSLEHGRRTAAAFPHAQLIELTDAGHAIPEERPAEVAHAIAAMLSTLAHDAR
ncbi:MAG TPA: alpha/beta hydrolase [Acidimicrobiia bacterium]|nr:alpha/beta hydrolase [Acidimicrobiia bacterium]